MIVFFCYQTFGKNAKLSYKRLYLDCSLFPVLVSFFAAEPPMGYGWLQSSYPISILIILAPKWIYFIEFNCI